MLFDVAKGLARRVPLTKLVSMDSDLRPYLAALMVSALHRAGGALIVPNDMEVRRVTRQAFESMLSDDSSKLYDQYGTISHGLQEQLGPEYAMTNQMQRLEKQLA